MLQNNWRATKHDGKLYVGTHNTILDAESLDTEEDVKNIYLRVAKKYDVKNRLNDGETVYGEVYGIGVQKGFDYGLKDVDLRLFDVMVDMRYVDYRKLVSFAEVRGFNLVPLLYDGPWTMDKMALANGKSSLAGHIKEGMVIRPWTERNEGKVGRVVLKHISESYLIGKHTESIPH